MEQLSPLARRMARTSLVAMWGATSLVSIQQLHGQSEALLLAAGVPSGWRAALIIGGAVVDGAMALALWRWHLPVVYRLAVANLIVMTAMATVLLPTLWLDPLGSLTKNLPIAALLWAMHQDSQR